MVIEKQLTPFWEWLLPASGQWLVVVACLIAAAAVLGLLVVTFRYGPVRGVPVVWKAISGGVVDLVRISPRRVWALTWLAFRESLRRRVVVVFAIFVLLLLAAGWFLDPGSVNPAKLYLSFVFTATAFLVALLALFLSVFSLPADIRNRTLHTVVTKPVRPSEIVLGRMGGFILVGTVLLAVMSVVSYLFVERHLEHTHSLPAGNLHPVGGAQEGQPRALEGKTEVARNHWHRVTIDPSGEGHVDPQSSHSHTLRATGPDGKTTYAVGESDDMLLARVPVYGKLRFCDLSGVDRTKGINVGDEWVYRSFIHGHSNAAAIWTFTDVREDQFPDGMSIETNIEVFRSHKGTIVETVPGSLSLRNPTTGLLVEARVEHWKEFEPLVLFIPRKIQTASNPLIVAQKIDTPEGIRQIPARLDKSLLKNPDGSDRKTFDLFDDLVGTDGRVEVWLKCLAGGQYFGTAQPDLYILARDAWFGVNFFKGFFGIWLEMVLIVAFGVMFSTFLSGPVAMLATAGVLVAGFSKDALLELAMGPKFGGGPIESFYRLITQNNMISPLEPGLKTTVIQMTDAVSEMLLRVFGSIIPPITDFSCANHVAQGFDIAWDPWILVPALRTLAFLVPLFVAGCFFLKTREVAR